MDVLSSVQRTNIGYVHTKEFVMNARSKKVVFYLGSFILGLIIGFIISGIINN